MRSCLKPFRYENLKIWSAAKSSTLLTVPVRAALTDQKYSIIRSTLLLSRYAVSCSSNSVRMSKTDHLQTVIVYNEFNHPPQELGLLHIYCKPYRQKSQGVLQKFFKKFLRTYQTSMITSDHNKTPLL